MRFISLLGLFIAIIVAAPVKASDGLTLGILPTAKVENGDGTALFHPIATHLEDRIGVPVTLTIFEGYDAAVSGFVGGEVDVIYFGAASYAAAFRATEGNVEPLAAIAGEDGSFGYYAALIVAADDPALTVDDLAGRRIGFVAEDSTSGYRAPTFFLDEAGYPMPDFFGGTLFTGSHPSNVEALLDGTVDVAAIWYLTDDDSAASLLGHQDDVRVIWRSPLLPDALFAARADLPAAIKQDVRAALIAMATERPEAWAPIAAAESMPRLMEVSAEDYDAVRRLVEASETAE